MATTDPGHPVYSFPDLPAADRAAGVNMLEKDVCPRLRLREEALRGRYCPPDLRGGTQSYSSTSSTSFVAFSWTGNIFIPPWASKLYMPVTLIATAREVSIAKLRVRARFGSASYIYTNECTVLLRTDGKQNADGILPDDSGVDYFKHFILEIPSGFLNTEQPFVWEMASGGGLYSGELISRSPWYFAI